MGRSSRRLGVSVDQVPRRSAGHRHHSPMIRSRREVAHLPNGQCGAQARERSKRNSSRLVAKKLEVNPDDLVAQRGASSSAGREDGGMTIKRSLLGEICSLVRLLRRSDFAAERFPPIRKPVSEKCSRVLVPVRHQAEGRVDTDTGQVRSCSFTVSATPERDQPKHCEPQLLGSAITHLA